MPKKIRLLFCALISGGPPLQWEGTKNRREGGLFWDSPQGAEGLWAGKGGHKQTGDAAFYSTQGGLFISKGPSARPLIGKSSIADSSMLLQRVRSAEVSACEGRAAARFSLKALSLDWHSPQGLQPPSEKMKLSCEIWNEFDMSMLAFHKQGGHIELTCWSLLWLAMVTFDYNAWCVIFFGCIWVITQYTENPLSLESLIFAAVCTMYIVSSWYLARNVYRIMQKYITR